MSGDSKPVSSSQQSCHPQLGRLVHKHLQHPTRRPPAAHTLAAFEQITARVEQDKRPLIFDSFCGTGMSTGLIAARHPDCLVIGIDKSDHRLHRHQPSAEADYLLVRAECGDFWRLAVTAGWRLQRHYLLYPNPWPKATQLKRRVHGSADLPALLALGGEIELRSNWQVYVEEFGSALFQAGEFPVIDAYEAEQALSLFEGKYLKSGHGLWRCRCKLVHNTPPESSREIVAR
ncbi:MAG: SAM-dependent methyltransferase [Halieaceae bacterium]